MSAAQTHFEGVQFMELTLDLLMAARTAANSGDVEGSVECLQAAATVARRGVQRIEALLVPSGAQQEA
jgi:hypothetical protein